MSGQKYPRAVYRAAHHHISPSQPHLNFSVNRSQPHLNFTVNRSQPHLNFTVNRSQPHLNFTVNRSHSHWTYSKLKYLVRENLASSQLPHDFLSSNLRTASSSSLRHMHTSPVQCSKSLSIEDMKPVKESEIKEFFTDRGLVYEEGFTCYITTCPKFVKKGLVWKKLDKLFVNRTTGYFVCESCKKSGSWYQYKENVTNVINLINQKKRSRLDECFQGQELSMTEATDIKKLQDYWENCLSLEHLTEDEWTNINHYLGTEDLKKETLSRFGVRTTADRSGLVLPTFQPDRSLAGLRITAVQHYKVKEQDAHRVVSRTIPRLSFDGLFGLHLVGSNSSEIVITSTELDAMAVYQQTGKPAIALPKGDSTLPQKVLPFLERFTSILLWLGGDMKEWVSAKQFSRKLGDRRCSLIRPSVDNPSPLKALQSDHNLSAVLRSAKPVVHKWIISFSNLRQEVYDELAQADQVAGVKWTRYPQLNTLLKGHRRGELTIFTGPTGAGKTTFISDFSVDLAMQGVNTLWGSFEINNVRLMKTMLRQYSQVNLVKHLSLFNEWADRFEQLPMYFMTFHGQENIQKVIETMSHAVYVHDIAHVIVDNLQFMMGMEGAQSSDRFLRQDQVISAFRKFATNMNCHVTLVVHPRKEKEDELSVSSIFGSAKASQEADNVLILQDKRLTSVRGKKYVQLAKNRYDGELGIMLLKFNKDTLSFFKDPKLKDGKEKESKDGQEKEESKYGDT